MFRKITYILLFVFLASCADTFDSVKRGLTGAKSDSAYPLHSVVWTGFIKADVSETFTFYINADDWAWLSINGRQVMQQMWSFDYSIYTRSKPVKFTAGKWVPIEVRLCCEAGWNGRPPVSPEGHSPGHFKMEWSSPSTKRGKIPTGNMKPE